jgi:tetratricopeptide (TPR) repeat protein
MCQLTPDSVPGQIALASIYVQAGRTELALAKIAEIRSKLGSKLTTNDQLLLVECEAWAELMRNGLPKAEKVLTAAQQQYPGASEPYKAMAEIYLNRREVTNAVIALGRLLEVQPNNVEALINSGGLKIRMAEYQEAIPFLDRALQLQPENLYALLNRGFANLQLGKLDDARRDYEILERTLPKPMHAVYYGLGEIAYKNKQKRTALQNYERYVKLAPAGTAEMRVVQERIKQLKSGTI